LQIEQLRKMIVLAAQRKKLRNSLVSKLTKLNNELDDVLKISHSALSFNATGKASTVPLARGDRPVSNIPDLTHARESATLLYDVLAPAWNSECHDLNTTINLRLATYRKLNHDARFRIILPSKPTFSPTWQESSVQIMINSGYILPYCHA
jgi:hypothetical protein